MRSSAIKIFTSGVLGLFITATSLVTYNQPTKAAFPPGYNGKIAFTSDRDRGDGYVDIYVTSPTPGSTVTRLTNNTGYVWDVHPAWSPDGSKIAFGRFLDGDYEVFVMNADGSNVIQLTNNDFNDYQPAWSPDGTKIAYSTEAVAGGDWEIWLMNVDGTGKTALTTNSGITDYEPDWSPNGTRIAFERDGEICIMDADGTDIVQLTQNNWYDAEPQWHPDGTKLVFTSVESGKPEISAINTGTKVVTHLTNDGFNKWEPCWSPDGQKILFQRNETGNDEDWEIVIINTDGSNTGKLTDNKYWDQHPAWQRLSVTPAEEVEIISTMVDTLVEEEVLSSGEGNSLIAKLNATERRLQLGDMKTAINTLHAFINQVNAFIKSGKLTTQAGQQLIDSANDLISRLTDT
jgi:Tol biopolymer transport system component